MKICMIVEDYPPNSGGGGIFVQETTKKLQKNHEITVITSGSNENSKSNENEKVIRMGKNRLFFVLNAIFYLVKKDGFDIYHAHGAIPGFIAKITSIFQKKKTILHVHGYRKKEIIGGFRFAIQNAFIKLGYNKIISVDKESSERIIGLGIGKNTVITIPCGVDTDAFRQKNTVNDKTKNIFLFVGRLEKVKNLETLLFAAKIALERKLNAEFWIIGNGKELEKLKSFANENKLSNTSFLGEVKRSEMCDIYSKAKFLVLPSLSEGMPLVILEAMACKTPVIVSDIPSLKRIVDESKAGFCFVTRNADDLAETIERTSKINEKEYKKLGELARAYAENFSWEVIAERINKEYENLAKQLDCI